MADDKEKISFSNRNPKPGVDKLFFKRWSPRSFVKSDISKKTLELIFDSARWSPSCYNEQPWTFLTSTEKSFDLFLDKLVDQNKIWAKNCSLIGFIIANRDFSFNGKENLWSEFDCGAAWMALALAVSKVGLYAHAMAGINKESVYRDFSIDRKKYSVVCGFAIGVIGWRENLPVSLQEREVPTPRKALDEIWKRDKF
ncbi:MAG: nitroreductase family protein [Candidatus Omnitrophica bacterium]|nr:nitroreductase family protein [Candidatus Omnitrophota bacterium]